LQDLVQLLCNLAINILMGCIHSSHTPPKQRDQKEEKAERPGIIWKLIRRFSRKTEVITQKEPFTVFTDTAIDNLIQHEDSLFQHNLEPWGNDALQFQDKPGPQQDVTPQQNLVPCHQDVTPQQNLVPCHQDDTPQQNLVPCHQDDTPQQNLVPCHQDVLQNDRTSQQTGEEFCGDLSSREVGFYHDITIDSLCEAGPLEHYIVNAYLNEIGPQRSQKTGEEANGDFNGREDDFSHEITLDSVCEAGPLEHDIVNAYLNEIGP
jgi:hypothetical protein